MEYTVESLLVVGDRIVTAGKAALAGDPKPLEVVHREMCWTDQDHTDWNNPARFVDIK